MSRRVLRKMARTGKAMAVSTSYPEIEGFVDCLKADETALANVVSLRFLSVAGTSNLNWSLVSHLWSKLRNLIGLDVSRTDIGPNAISSLFSSLHRLRVWCALNCSNLEEDHSFVLSNNNSKVKSLLTLFNDIFEGISSVFAENAEKEGNAFLDRRSAKCKHRNLDEIMICLEWILSHSLLRIMESSPQGLDSFWLSQGATLLISLMQSDQKDVKERAATGLATLVVIDDENASIDCGRAEAVMKGGGIYLLLYLANS
ncbi:hypothetical protein Nepgr_023488 [Nepenthes gracilis]|uniref:Uncharacterized protein n=1 Tax=Nepenthes gracilis TaxID=150966 RepID=A0AAD3XZG8_NEPGR|nr:hypothetical protein Nepgr_023488 [Nepenthes gracilis]